MGVYRTRASLELVLEAAPTAGSDSTLVSTLEAATAMEDDDNDKGTMSAVRGGAKADSLASTSESPTLWMRRKKSFKLKLEGISMRGTKRRTAIGQETPQTPGVQLLELFENMMEARMESCERVSRMVREVEMADL